jgi:pimeloyl-ACP methyl ester carboxylesterase
MRAPAGPTPESYLERVQCPVGRTADLELFGASARAQVLVLWGDSDPWTPLDKGMHPGIRFPEYCKDCKLAVLANTGHCPHDERPEEV